MTKYGFRNNDLKAKEVTADEENKIRKEIEEYKLEGDYYEDNVWIDDEDVGQPVQGGGQP